MRMIPLNPTGTFHPFGRLFDELLCGFGHRGGLLKTVCPSRSTPSYRCCPQAGKSGYDPVPDWPGAARVLEDPVGSPFRGCPGEVES